MLTYEECKAIAIEFARKNNIVLKDVLKYKDFYEFDNCKLKSSYMLPFIVDANTGKIENVDVYIWNYRSKGGIDKSINIDFETGDEIESEHL